MKNLKLMPKIFLYTLFSMLLVVGLSQGLIYLLAPRLQFALSNQADLVFSFNNYRLVAGAIGGWGKFPPPQSKCAGWKKRQPARWAPRMKSVRWRKM